MLKCVFNRVFLFVIRLKSFAQSFSNNGDLLFDHFKEKIAETSFSKTIDNYIGCNVRHRKKDFF